jgi:Fe-Mn family superoxide dismutase
MRFHARPISFKPPRLVGLSARLLASHYENNYGGAVRRLNAIADELAASDPATLPGFRLNGLKREELIASNSMLLHEVYFDSLGEGGGGDPPTDLLGGALAAAIVRDFGSLERWRAEFVAMGKALGGGSGWVVLTRSPRDGRLANVWGADHTHSLAGGTPLLALDMYEHSYHIDFGSNAAGYVDAFMANIAWSRIAARFAGDAAASRPHMIDAPTAKAMLDADPDLLVVDARLALDAKTVPVRLRGARRAPPEKVDEVAASLPKDRKVLVYCAWGFEIGGDCAAKFRERGIDAVGLAGGIGTWRANGLPTEPLSEGDTP